jgi:YcxB-like protein
VSLDKTALQVEIVYMPEYRDFVRGFFWWYLYKYWMFYALMAFLGALLLFSPIVSGELISILGVLAPIACAAVTLYAVFPSARESVDQIIKEPARLVFTSQGMSGSDGQEQESVPWSVYHKALETKSEFILMAHDRMLPLPKRVFDNEEQLGIFRMIVQQAFGKKAKLKG